MALHTPIIVKAWHVSSSLGYLFHFTVYNNLLSTVFFLFSLNTLGTNGQYIAAGHQAKGKVNIWNITNNQRHSTLQVFQGNTLLSSQAYLSSLMDISTIWTMIFLTRPCQNWNKSNPKVLVRYWKTKTTSTTRKCCLIAFLWIATVYWHFPRRLKLEPQWKTNCDSRFHCGNDTGVEPVKY